MQRVGLPENCVVRIVRLSCYGLHRSVRFYQARDDVQCSPMVGPVCGGSF